MPVWIALDGDHVVGQIAVQPACLQVQEDTHRAGWIVDVMVLPSHRGQGLGHQLYQAVARDVNILVTLTMADATRRMAERLGCITLGAVHQFTRWVRLDAATVRRYLLVRTANHRWANRMTRSACGRLRLHEVLAAIANLLLDLRDRRDRSTTRIGTTTIVEVGAFGADIDALWERTRAAYPAIFPRNARFLNWRFVDCPELNYRRFIATRDGATVGYVVVRRAEPVELPQGLIVDLYAARDDRETIEALVVHSIDLFRRGVAAVDCATSAPEFAAVLRAHGFFRTRAARPTVVCGNAFLGQRLASLKDAWFLSKADHDWDQIHVAEPASHR